MMILPNQRHEKFAQRVASGESATAAYRLVYAKAKNADVMGPRLLGNVGVRARVAELQSRSATGATLTMPQMREIACAIATLTSTTCAVASALLTRTCALLRCTSAACTVCRHGLAQTTALSFVAFSIVIVGVSAPLSILTA